MIRLESKEKKHFWEVFTSESTVISRAGKLGSDGKETQSAKQHEAGAQKHAEKQIQSYLKKGYVQVLPTVDAEPENQELSALIEANTDDDGAYLVYADWLLAQNHPRGELIMLQHRLRSTPEIHQDESIKKAIASLTKKHPQLHLPEKLAKVVKNSQKEIIKQPYKEKFASRFQWKNGYIHEARITLINNAFPFTIRELMDELFALPSSRFLHKLEQVFFDQSIEQL